MTEDFVIETDWQPGLIGEIAAAHGRYYAENWRFGLVFEAQVATGCAAYMKRAGPQDLTLSVWQESRFAGSLILDLNDPDAPGQAHIRWFIVTSPGRGLGRMLLVRAMAHLDQRELPCFLTTFKGLDAARTLYEEFGFVLSEQKSDKTWGTRVEEQRFDRPAKRPD